MKLTIAGLSFRSIATDGATELVGGLDAPALVDLARKVAPSPANLKAEEAKVRDAMKRVKRNFEKGLNQYGPPGSPERVAVLRRLG